MVGVIYTFLSTSSQSNLSADYRISTIQATSVDALHGDSDLLIKEYFRSNSEQRAKSRAKVASQLKSYKSILVILGWANLPTTKDAYDGAVDLLAECKDILLADAYSALLILSKQAAQSHNLQELCGYERSWEVLIQGIGCACHLSWSAQFKLKLLQDIAMNLLPILNRRGIKATLLDSLANLCCELENLDWIVKYINWVASHDRDEYIRDYAQETLAELV